MFQISYPHPCPEAQTRKPVEVVMSTRAVVIALASVVFLVPACGGNDGVSSQAAGEDSRVRAVLDTYLRSIDTANVALASEVWAHGPTVEAVTPLGRFKGWDTVRDELYVNFLQRLFTERRLTASSVSLRVAGDIAWVVFDWSFAATRADGQPYASTGWESHVYQKGDGRWALVHVHFSGPVQPQ
jgi:ketosteroid isomerase-like protein